MSKHGFQKHAELSFPKKNCGVQCERHCGAELDAAQRTLRSKGCLEVLRDNFRGDLGGSLIEYGVLGFLQRVEIHAQHSLKVPVEHLGFSCLDAVGLRALDSLRNI